MDDVKIDFGELSGDNEFKERINSFQKKFKDVHKIIDQIISSDVYDTLSPEDKVRYDLFLSFAINSLFWYYLRVKGKDPNQCDIKEEIKRMKDYMNKSKKIYERKFMPRIDQEAAKRFVRSGLFDLHNPSRKEGDREVASGSTSKTVISECEREASAPNARKRKREDSDEDDK